MRWSSLLAILVAAGGCATESNDDVWPCGSWTEISANGHAFYTTYAWDEHHNLVLYDVPGEQTESWVYDPSGTIAVDQRTEEPGGYTQWHRDVVGGRVMKETMLWVY